MNHVFSVDEAKSIGLDKAVILSNFRYWLTKNQANKKNVHEGSVWTYNSSRALSIIFPYWSPQKISRLIRDLEKDGYLLSGNFNKAGYDRTKWDSMPEFSIVQNETLHCSNLNNGLFNNEQPIPDINTDNKPDLELVSKIIDSYIEIVKSECNVSGVIKQLFVGSDKRMKPLLDRISESEDHKSIEFWRSYFEMCKGVSWIREGINGEPTCTIDMLFNKTKFYKNIEAFWS